MGSLKGQLGAKKVGPGRPKEGMKWGSEPNRKRNAEIRKPNSAKLGFRFWGASQFRNDRKMKVKKLKKKKKKKVAYDMYLKLCAGTII
jgi:hypothetical protein